MKSSSNSYWWKTWLAYRKGFRYAEKCKRFRSNAVDSDGHFCMVMIIDIKALECELEELAK